MQDHAVHPDSGNMTSKPQGSPPRASRTRIAVALCIAGLATGALGGSPDGAGAQDRAPYSDTLAPAPEPLIASAAGAPAEPATITPTTPQRRDMQDYAVHPDYA